MFGKRWVGAAVLVAGVMGLVGCPGRTNNAVTPAPPLLETLSGSNTNTANASPAARSHHGTKQTADWNLGVYSNPDYGISFRYPRGYALEGGEIEEHSFFLRRQDELEPGTKLLATVLIPEDGYPNTNFEHGSLQVLVHEDLDQDGCKELVDPDGGALDARRVGLITAESTTFWWSEEKSSTDGTQMAEREYTTFLSGRCYEFYAVVALRETTDEDVAEKQADARKILRQLEKILLSVRLYATPVIPSETSFAKTEPRL